MPQSRPSSRTGRRLLTTGLLSAVVVLGTPAVALAETPGLSDVPVIGDLVPGATTSSPSVSPAVPGSGLPGLGSVPGAGALPGADALPDAISGGAACVQGLVTGIQVSVTGIAEGLTGLLTGLLGGSSVPLVPGGDGSATATIPMTPEQLQALLTPEQLADLLAGGGEDLTVGIPVLVGGVTELVEVVFDFVDCLAALVPTPSAAPPTTVAPAVPAAPTTTAAPAPTSAPAAVQPVAYPGYAPTGGAPGEESDAPLALAGLGVLTAAGASALWLRSRRGVTG